MESRWRLNSPASHGGGDEVAVLAMFRSSDRADLPLAVAAVKIPDSRQRSRDCGRRSRFGSMLVLDPEIQLAIGQHAAQQCAGGSHADVSHDASRFVLDQDRVAARQRCQWAHGVERAVTGVVGVTVTGFYSRDGAAVVDVIPADVDEWLSLRPQDLALSISTPRSPS